MTIHFRTRIQSPINYSEYLFPGVSGCCCTLSSDEGGSFFASTFAACNALGGYFKVSETCEGDCLPKGQTGCCCACSYGGMTSGIEKTLCEDLGGNWMSGECPETSAEICISGTKNFSDYKKCCGYTLIAGITQTECFNVCTEEECSKLTVGNLIPVFNPSTNCTINPVCPGTQGLQEPPNSTFLTGDPEKDTYGNCCVQGIPCTCFTGINLYTCKQLNGSFYVLGEQDYPCSECINNCTEGEL